MRMFGFPPDDWYKNLRHIRLHTFNGVGDWRILFAENFYIENRSHFDKFCTGSDNKLTLLEKKIKRSKKQKKEDKISKTQDTQKKGVEVPEIDSGMLGELPLL